MRTRVSHHFARPPPLIGGIIENKCHISKHIYFVLKITVQEKTNASLPNQMELKSLIFTRRSKNIFYYGGFYVNVLITFSTAEFCLLKSHKKTHVLKSCALLVLSKNMVLLNSTPFTQFYTDAVEQSMGSQKNPTGIFQYVVYLYIMKKKIHIIISYFYFYVLAAVLYVIFTR